MGRQRSTQLRRPFRLVVGTVGIHGRLPSDVLRACPPGSHPAPSSFGLAVGLDGLGWRGLDAPEDCRPALVLDMMEEFRPLLADAAAVSAVNRRIVRPEDFTHDETGLVLSERGVESFVRHFDGRMRDTVAHPTLALSGTYRYWVEHQARVLARVVIGEIEDYRAFTPGH